MSDAIRIVSWNIRQCTEAWNALVNSDIDVALLQEARQPPASISDKIQVDDLPWKTGGRSDRSAWRTCVARLSDRVRLRHLPLSSIADATPGHVAISRMGTLSVAELEIPETEKAITLVSLYGAWELPVTEKEKSYSYADASVHRSISDLSVLITRKCGRAQRMIVAGDLNIYHGYGEYRYPDWKARYETIFARMKAIGLPLVGPQAPNGRQATSRPAEIPAESQNVPTYYTAKQQAEGAAHQLDFVFASDDLREQIHVRALNAVDQWGPSDHCQVLIELQK